MRKLWGSSQGLEVRSHEERGPEAKEESHPDTAGVALSSQLWTALSPLQAVGLS